nr:MAG TPA: hypothetical protein [Caudoviricetes sp.]DAN64478.1 MAG TPA: hypothetical protein [Caudoviricetes sp.]
MTSSRKKSLKQSEILFITKNSTGLFIKIVIMKDLLK